MFNTGAYGAVTVDNASNALAIKRVTSQLIDISAGTIVGGSAASLPLLSAPADNSIGIFAINLLYQATCNNTAGSINFGIVSDADAVGVALATSNTALVGTRTRFTASDFASTLKRNIHKAGGLPVIDPGLSFIMALTAGASNAGDFVVEVEYFDIEPGT